MYSLADMRRRRRALSLLEVVIALSSAAVLLFFLFGFYRQLTVLDIEAERVQERIFARERIQLRLMQLFSKLPPENEQSPPLFYTESTPDSPSTALIFSFDQGLDPDPNLSGTVEAELLLTKSKKLELHTRPFQEKIEGRKEILAEKISSLSLYFFDPVEESWQPSWEKGKSTPTMVKLLLKEEGESQEVSFAFFLPSSQLPVKYDAKAASK